MKLETAFTMDTSSIKFGKGVTKEIGIDFNNMGVKRLMICTDNRVAKLSTMEVVEASLKDDGLEYEIYSGVSVEPTDVSFLEAIDFAKKGKFDFKRMLIQSHWRRHASVVCQSSESIPDPSSP